MFGISLRDYKRGKIKYIYPSKKKIPISGQNSKTISPPHTPTKNNGQEYSYKNLYTYPGKKDGYIWEE